MKVIGLLSGGKDSCFNLMHCVANGHDIVALATLAPPEDQPGEMDSWMYQTAGHDAVPMVAQAMGLPLFLGHIKGSARDTGAQYAGGDDQDETEDLARLLRSVHVAHPDAEAVSVGAIQSNYQRVRVEHVCSRLKMCVLSYLWKRPQATLVNEMVSAGLEAVIIKVAGAGLGSRDLGKSLGMLRPKLDFLARQYGAHVAGEGGEYETLTLDSPLHVQGRVDLGETKVVMHVETGGIADVAYLAAREAFLTPKPPEQALQALQSLVNGPIPRPAMLDKLSRVVSQHLPPSTSEPPPEYAAHQMPWGTTSDLPSSRSMIDEGSTLRTITVTGESSKGSMAEAAQNTFESLRDTLHQHCLYLPSLAVQEASHGRPDTARTLVVDHINVYLSSQDEFAQLNQEYGKHFQVAPPSRACIALPQVSPVTSKVMLTLIGRVESGKPVTDPRHARSALHVQSRSYWAPANIGPYAQAVISPAGTITIAGQIALDPSTMNIPSSAGNQAVLSLQHVRRILRAALIDLRAAASSPKTGKLKHYVQGGIAWVTDRPPDADSSSNPLEGGTGSEYVAAKDLAAAADVLWAHRYQDDGDEDEEDEDPEQAASDAWHTSWMGQASDPPILYAVLPQGALPRQARIEWQVLAHTGVPHPDVVANDKAQSAATREGDLSDNDADEDEWEQITVRTRSWHEQSSVYTSAHYEVVGEFKGSKVSELHIDLYALNSYEHTSCSAAVQYPKDATDLRVFLTPNSEHGTRNFLSRIPHYGKTDVPVLDLFAKDPSTNQLRHWDAAVVWSK